MQCSVIGQYSDSPSDVLSSSNCAFFTYFEQNYHKIYLPKGRWLFELWGARGGLSLFEGESSDPGLGAYVSGIINIKESTTVYGYVGGKGSNSGEKSFGVGGYNGGANGANDIIDENCLSGGGGGATDIRLQIDDLYSRIIVAAGGGSPGCNRGGKGGSGGTILGKNGENNTIYSTLFLGGKGADNENLELFGRGEEGLPGNEAGGSGGGGYFGGYGGGQSLNSTTIPGGGGGGGGSSYASGCIGCKTIYKDNSTHGSLHYSGYAFNYIQMISGDDSIPIYENSEISYTPYKDHGLIRISRYYLNQFQDTTYSMNPISFTSLHLFLFSLIATRL